MDPIQIGPLKAYKVEVEGSPSKCKARHEHHTYEVKVDGDRVQTS
jgi:hypothetical protein